MQSIAWVKRILEKETSSFWKILIEKNLRSVGGNLIWSCNFDNQDSLLSNIKNNFLVDVLVAWSDFRFQYHEGTSQSLNRNEIIWNNSYIKINSSSFFYKKWHKQGNCKISHLMDAYDNFLSLQAFQLKYSQLKCNFLEYFSVITAIKNSQGFLNSPLKNAISFTLKQEKICKSVYPYILMECGVSFEKYKQMAKYLSKQNFSVVVNIYFGLQGYIAHKITKLSVQISTPYYIH